VISAGELCFGSGESEDFGSATEFTGHDDEDIIKKSAFVEVFDQC
jgi:hypothetical protein